MSKNKSVSLIFLIIIICILIWCIGPLLIMVGWNNIIVKLTGFNPMTYWDGFWIYIIFVIVFKIEYRYNKSE